VSRKSLPCQSYLPSENLTLGPSPEGEGGQGPGIPKRVEATAFSVLNQKAEIVAQVPPGAVTGPIRVLNETGADSTSENFVIS